MIMAKSRVRKKPVHQKRPGLNPVQRKALAKKNSETVSEYLTRMRHRMAWMFLIALDECDKVDVDQDTLMDIIDKFCETNDEYNVLMEKDGEEIADEKLNMRVNKILGLDPMEDTPDKIRGEGNYNMEEE